ncbi:RNase J family beta-CASP ribonuclease [archaeon]|jgi:ribonuclease J|nr:RNase J family beta-CASP ribonuclease [archaeon]MBT3451164.1 RNase J family beta-CASP ribonuclease [archaeon]MBT6869698.1 RNase J family beta-CASP ribonuclease [archaeon]MBT7192627.1 RNase J family beta-CASP ribonuclease [archaeon]MBT7380512.1 RNase J family beta-CASP ribonuclease [archaeon]
MSIEICSIGGYSECGKNCTAVKIDDEVIIIDIGLNMENYVKHTQDQYDDVVKREYNDLLSVNAVPNMSLIKDWKNKVKAIVASHGHLDHIGAIPFVAGQFPKVPIISTPYTSEILKSILRDERLKIPNRIVAQNPNSKIKISKNITIELVYVTHSIPQASLVVIHTIYGKIVYANDFKLDNTPTLGQKTNIKRLKEISKEGVKLLISESLYAGMYGKSPSESIAKQMLKEVVGSINCDGKGIIMTTFASHIARLKSMIEIGKTLNRKIVFFGRSLDKYVKAAEKLNLVNFTKDVNIYRRRGEIEKVMNRINKLGNDKYLIICTGHQGEERAILSRIADNELPLKSNRGDLVIFSCSVIPVELNKENRKILERKLIKKGLRIFPDVHSSGHGYREDYRELIHLLNPENIVPSHAGHDLAEKLIDLAEEMGYYKNKNIFLMENGKRLKLE